MAETKTCFSCCEEKPLTDFHLHSKNGKRHPRCKRCRKDQHYLRLYGIGIDEYEDLFEVQGGLCALCRKPEHIIDRRSGEVVRLSVDHSHETGEVRGLLCRRCNYVVGVIESVDATWLKAAWQYLKGGE